jgi:hypothetical protein
VPPRTWQKEEEEGEAEEEQEYVVLELNI